MTRGPAPPGAAQRRRDRQALRRTAAAVHADLRAADHLGTDYTITRTPGALRQALLAAAPVWTTRVRYPRATADNGRHLEEIAVVVDPWRPAPDHPADPADAVGRPGTWSAAAVRAAIAEALDTLCRLPGDRPAGYRCALPPVVREAIESYGWQATRVRRPVTLGETAGLDIVLEWLFWLDDVAQRRAVVGLGLGVPLRRLARTLGVSHTQVSRLETAAITALVDRLNAGAECGAAELNFAGVAA